MEYINLCQWKDRKKKKALKGTGKQRDFIFFCLLEQLQDSFLTKENILVQPSQTSEISLNLTDSYLLDGFDCSLLFFYSYFSVLEIAANGPSFFIFHGYL